MPQHRHTSTKQQPPRPTVHQTRFLLCIVLVILFIVFSQHADELQMLGLFVALLSINFLEPVFTLIDHLDPPLNQLTKTTQSSIQTLWGQHFPSFQHRWKRSLHLLITCLFAFLTLWSFLHPIMSKVSRDAQDFFCLRTSLPFPPSLCRSGLGVTILPSGERIGLLSIDNQRDAPFDSSSQSSNEREVEQLIFSEDTQACALSQPHITLAVVTLLSRTSDDPAGSARVGLDELRGAYLAQHDYNVTSPPIRLCLLIANLGTQGTSLQRDGDTSSPTTRQIMKQLVQYSRYDRSFRGMIGFPYSVQVKDAVRELLDWQKSSLPLISPSATSNDLSILPGYTNFHRVSSPNDRLGEAMARYVCSSPMQQRKPDGTLPIAIFADSTDSYSSTLSASFQKTLQACSEAARTVDAESYHNGDAQSIYDALADALKKKDQFIFFPGYSSELDMVEEQEQKLQMTARSHLSILNGDGFYDITNASHHLVASIYSAIYASPIARQDSKESAFFNEYAQHFPLPYLSSALQAYHYDLLPEGVLTTYEATEAFTATLRRVGKDEVMLSQENFDNVLSHISFNAFSSTITFQGNATSDPDPLPIDIMCMDATLSMHWVALYGEDNRLRPAQSGTCV